VICTAEYSGERIDCDDKVVVRRARITSVCEHWTERTRRLFAVDCTRLAANRYTEEDQRERLHAVLDVMVAIEKLETAILMRYLAGEEGPFVEEGAP